MCVGRFVVLAIHGFAVRVVAARCRRIVRLHPLAIERVCVRPRNKHSDEPQREQQDGGERAEVKGNTADTFPALRTFEAEGELVGFLHGFTPCRVRG